MQHSGSITFYVSNSFHVQYLIKWHHAGMGFELFYLVNIIFLIYLWVPYLLSDLTCIKVSFVNFKSNLSILPKRYANNILSSDTMQVWVDQVTPCRYGLIKWHHAGMGWSSDTMQVWVDQVTPCRYGLIKWHHAGMGWSSDTMQVWVDQVTPCRYGLIKWHHAGMGWSSDTMQVWVDQVTPCRYGLIKWHHAGMGWSSDTMQVWVDLYTFLLLFKHFLNTFYTWQNVYIMFSKQNLCGNLH